MANVDLIMPKMGESIMEATILKWLKNVGDRVEAEESVLEIATDKVDSEVPSSVSGTITEILFREGDVVAVGKPVARINAEAAVGSGNGSPGAPVSGERISEAREEEPVAEPGLVAPTASLLTSAAREPQTARSSGPAPASSSGLASGPVQASGHASPTTGRFYSPLVLNIAREEGISISELETLAGSGQGGRVTKRDILGYVQGRADGAGAQGREAQGREQPGRTAAAGGREASSGERIGTSSDKPARTGVTSVLPSGNVEIVEMDRMRKLIADHMVNSKRTSPHVTSFVEADVTNIVLWREKIKKRFQDREGEKLTFTPIFIEAIVKALKDFPFVNSSVDGYTIIRKKDINIGMATALPNGNLIVPVIRNADGMNLVGLAKRVNDLANRARSGQLRPDEIEAGTFTITNVGTFGNLMGTPIINQPQVAILATGAIKKKPVVIETEHGDMIGIRQMMFLSHSYDHRVVDGAMGGAFVRRVADYLEGFDTGREI
ncbi:MAG TPA: dihydrolipoamide acetyltransferase family protein [Geopsychrobacteraceae bacterium]